MAIKAGTDNKRNIWILIGLAAVAAVVFTINLMPSGDSSSKPAPHAASMTPSPAATPADARVVVPKRRGTSSRNTGEFNPIIGPKSPNDKPSSDADPTLRTDLLAKLQGVNVEGSSRNLFQVGAEPVKVDTKLTKEPKILVKPPMPSTPPATPGPVEAVKAHAPPINFKYYGFTDSKAGRKKAFFLDGEDIIVASEGDLVKRRYKIVKIGINSVTIEDTDFKENQTVPLTPPETNG